MTALCLRLLILVGMSHAFRYLGGRLGPRWAGMVAGLPCSTALMLYGRGLDGGVVEVAPASDAILIGLSGMAVLPLAFVGALMVGLGGVRAAIFGSASYLIVTATANGLDRAFGGNCPTAVALLSVVSAGLILPRLAGWPAVNTSIRIRLKTARSSKLAGYRAIPVGWLRTLIPSIVFVSMIVGTQSFGDRVGLWLGTFPALSLTSLILTWCESGPRSSIKLAQGLPLGNLATFSFLFSVAPAMERWGLVGGLALSYAAAFLTLAGLLLLSHNLPGQIIDLVPRRPRRFSPNLEVIVA